MVSRVALIAALSVLCASGHALDLTPRSHTSELEGTKTEITAFRNGSEIVTWQPPSGWAISGEPSRLRLIPDDASQADAGVESRPVPPAAALDAAFAKELKRDVAQGIPREATALAWAEDEPNPLLMNRHPTYKVTCSYEHFGQQFVKTVWVCNFAQQQLRFHLTARNQDFKRLQESFRQSLYTWQGLP